MLYQDAGTTGRLLRKLCVEVQGLQDLAGIYRTWNPQYKSWSVFGQDHVARVLLNYPISESHDAVGDAVKSVRLFNLSQQLQQDPTAWEQAKVRLQAVCLRLQAFVMPKCCEALSELQTTKSLTDSGSLRSCTQATSQKKICDFVTHQNNMADAMRTESVSNCTTAIVRSYTQHVIVTCHTGKCLHPCASCT